jgi:hypothetical protein
MTRAAAFKLSDVQRAVKAVQAAGLTVHAVEVTPDGTVRVLTGPAGAAMIEDPATVAWEVKYGLRPGLKPGGYEQWKIDQGLLKIMPDGARVDIPHAKTERGKGEAEAKALSAQRRGNRRG